MQDFCKEEIKRGRGKILDRRSNDMKSPVGEELDGEILSRTLKAKTNHYEPSIPRPTTGCEINTRVHTHTHMHTSLQA